MEIEARSIDTKVKGFQYLLFKDQEGRARSNWRILQVHNQEDGRVRMTALEGEFSDIEMENISQIRNSLNAIHRRYLEKSG